RCAADGRSVVLLDVNGRFKARIEGPVNGNVLLRAAQYAAASNAEASCAIARNAVAGKIQNCRQVLLRGAREATAEDERQRLAGAADYLTQALSRLKLCADTETARGCEGDAARAYFQVFQLLVREDREAFPFDGRTRRPPLDRINALLSFIYTLLRTDCVSAAEGVGLDPQIGFLHVMRPGRPALGLDLMEELRGIVADRLVLSLVNRRQVKREDFNIREGGSVMLTDTARREVITAYQKRKQEDVQHHVLGRKVPLGLVPHVQARLLARHLRGDLPEYLPFLYH
ncbi:MAG: type I-C CRISPR-associated endonuclease Cas1c, partial [Ktedonobacterales bacterium]